MIKYGLVNENILKNPSLSIQAKALYAVLCTYADINRKCYPSINTLSNNLNKSKIQIRRYLRELKQNNYLKKEKNIFILL